MKKHFNALLAALLTATILTSASALTVTADSTRQMGDVNNDGKVTVFDSLIAQRHILKLLLLTEEDASYADLDGSGRLDITDCIEILRIAVGYESQNTLYVPSEITLQCGDRTDLNIKVPSDSGITYKYSLDNAISNDSSGEPVLKITNTGKIKAHHPGKSVVTVKLSNGTSKKCTVYVENKTTSQTITVGNNSLNITKKLMTNNDCYNTEDDYTIKGIVVHSTATPGVKAAEWYPMWNLSYEKGQTDREVCVHAFLDDEGVYQYLPYELVGWHVGGAANRSHIGFEICEPSGFYYYNNVISGYNVSAQQKYFDKIWKNATTYCAYLCNEYNLSVDNVISHKEANDLGLGTAHGDPDHWFKLHGKTMNDFRNSVRALLKNSSGVTVGDSFEVYEPDIQSSGNPFADGEPINDMFTVWGDNSRSLRD